MLNLFAASSAARRDVYVIQQPEKSRGNLAGNSLGNAVATGRLRHLPVGVATHKGMSVHDAKDSAPIIVLWSELSEAPSAH